MAAAAVLYAAKSTADERGSILTQLADCRAAAEAEDREVIAEHHDEAAAAFKGNRGAGLTRAKDAAIKAGAELWVQHSDRLARGDGITADHLAEVWFALRRHGAGSGRCKMTGESECGARGAVSSPVPMDAGRTSALLLARTGSAVASSRAT